MITVKTARVGMRSDVRTRNVSEDSTSIVSGAILRNTVRTVASGKKNPVQIGNVMELLDTKLIGIIFLITAHARGGILRFAKTLTAGGLLVSTALGVTSQNIVRIVRGGTQSDAPTQNVALKYIIMLNGRDQKHTVTNVFNCPDEEMLT